MRSSVRYWMASAICSAPMVSLSARSAKYLQYPHMFLVGSAFWNKILPNGIDFNEFTKIYNEAISQINLNEKLNEMIRSCS